jgi:hypothetical protein
MDNLVYIRHGRNYIPSFIYTHRMPMRKGKVGKSEFSKWFHNSRLLRCRTIKQMSEDVGITRYYLTGFETGKVLPNDAQIDVLAEYFKVTSGIIKKMISLG